MAVVAEGGLFHAYSLEHDTYDNTSAVQYKDCKHFQITYICLDVKRVNATVSLQKRLRSQARAAPMLVHN